MVARRQACAVRFQRAVELLLADTKIDQSDNTQNLSLLFEEIATNLMMEVPGRETHWYDGVVELSVHRRKVSQLEFEGEMWVSNHKTQWKEDFRARVTDKRITKQGMEIVLWIGDDRVQGNLNAAFGIESG